MDSPAAMSMSLNRRPNSYGLRVTRTAEVHLKWVSSLTMEQNNYVILAIEHHEIKGHGEIKSPLQTHVRTLRKFFPASIFIFIPESNLGHEASHMAHMLKKEPRLRTMTEKSEPVLSPRTNAKNYMPTLPFNSSHPAPCTIGKTLYQSLSRCQQSLYKGNEIIQLAAKDILSHRHRTIQHRR